MESREVSPKKLSNNGKRIAACFIDSVLAAMLSMILFAAVGAPLFHYYDLARQINSSLTAIDQAVEPTHLLPSGDEIHPSSAGEKKAAQNWIVAMVADTYISSSDILRYYKVDYLNQDIQVYNAQFLNGSYSSLFTDPGNGLTISLTAEAKAKVKAYLYSSDTSAEASGTHASLYNAFVEVFRADWTEFGKSEAYSTLYTTYLTLNSQIRYAAGGAALVSYSLAALISYVGLPFVWKKGRTFAKRVLQLEVISSRGQLTPYQIVSRGLIESLEFAFLSIFSPFFFIQLPASLFLPVFGSGSTLFTLLTVLVASGLALALSGGLTLFSKEKTSLHDLATLTLVVDSNAYAERQKEEAQEHGEND